MGVPSYRVMERTALLIARIALYRRYLNEGVDGDVARAYLWQIKRDEAALAAIAEEHADEPPDATGAALPSARSETPEDGG